jgi:hypothetical protein
MFQRFKKIVISCLINHGENTQNLDLNNSAPWMDGLANLANINRIIVTLAVGGWVGVVGILAGNSAV